MTTTLTRTTTHTVVDVRKVVDRFAADFSMMAQSTGLRTDESVAGIVSDLKIFAEEGLLHRVHVILKDESGSPIRAASYDVSDSASGWTNDRPGGNLWPRMQKGVLFVLATLSDRWWHGMSETERAIFRRAKGIKGAWEFTHVDTTFPGLTSSYALRYSSNGYGWERTNYN